LFQLYLHNARQIANEIHTYHKYTMTYGYYLDLDRLLGAQHPVSRPEHHDEMLFIIQHQTTELWFRLVIHELLDARRLIAEDELQTSLNLIAPGDDIHRTLTTHRAVL